MFTRTRSRLFVSRSIKLLLPALLLGVGNAARAQVLNTVNGHYYEYVSSPGIFWTAAKTQAEELSFKGLHGYLATVTSAQETSFFASDLPDALTNNSFLGGFQDTSAPDYSEPSGGWRWVTGEAWDYTNWANGEPNNAGEPKTICISTTPVMATNGTTSTTILALEGSS